MFFIKTKVKGYLKNLTENTEELIDTSSIRKSNIISYIQDDIKHKLIIEKTKITLIRENKDFSHTMIFEQTKEHLSEYYLKNENYSLELNILTTKLVVENNKINIIYKVLESENIYNYLLEMSDIYEY